MALEAEGSNPLLTLSSFRDDEKRIFNIMGCRQAVKAQDFDSCIRGFESRQPRDYSQPDFSENRSRAAFSILRKHGQWILIIYKLREGEWHADTGDQLKSKAEREQDEKKYKERIFRGEKKNGRRSAGN